MSNEMKTDRRDESNKVARLLTLTQLSARALVSGIPMGFNGAEAVHFVDGATFEDIIQVTWGDQKLMRRPCLRTLQSWALSYAADEPCIRNPKTLILPMEVLSESCEALDRRFTAALLELAQDPAVRDEPVSQKVAPQ
jgi:hypothetical protein